MKVARRLASHNVGEVLNDLFTERGVPVHIRFCQWFGIHRKARQRLVGEAAGPTAIHRSR